jgi:hypothetical protein
VYMASVSGTTNEGTPFLGEPFIFPSFGNIGPPYIATLSLPRLTIRLPVWFFSTLVISNVPCPSNAIPSPQEHPPHVDPSPSSPIAHLLPFLLLRLVKALKLVTRWIRRRRKGILRRRKIRRGQTSNHCRTCWKQSTNYCQSGWEY